MSFDNQLTPLHLPVLCNIFNRYISRALYAPLLIDNILTCSVIFYTVFYTWLINIHLTIIVIFWSTCFDKIPGLILIDFTPQYSILENIANYAVMYLVTYDTCTVWLTCILFCLYLAVLKVFILDFVQFCIALPFVVLTLNDLVRYYNLLIRPFHRFTSRLFRLFNNVS